MTTLINTVKTARYIVRIVDVKRLYIRFTNVCMYRDAPKDWHIKSWPGKPIWTDIPLKLRKGWYKDIHHVFIDQHRYAMNKGVVLHKSDSVQMHWDRLWSRILADSQKKLQSLNGLGDRAIKKQSDRDIKKHNKDRDRRLGTDITNSNK